MNVAVKDQDCPCNAEDADFFVNSEGEMVRNGVLIPSSLSLSVIAQENGFIWEEVFRYTVNDTSEKAIQWFKTVDKAIDARLRNELTVREYNFYKKVSALQERADFSTFRVYGEIRNGRHRIVGVTEFLDFCDNDKFWTELNLAAKRLKAHVWVMRESKHEDQTWVNHGHPADEVIEGPNHGRMERQVELSWRIEKMTPDELTKFMKMSWESVKHLDSYSVRVC